MYSASSSLFNIYGFKANDSNKDFSFETSLIKNRKNKLLKVKDYEKLLSQDFEDIYKALNTLNYKIGIYDSESSILEKLDEHFKEEFKKLAKKIALSQTTDKLIETPIFKYLFIPFDFFNMKVLFKGLKKETPFENLLFSSMGLVTKENLNKIYHGKEISFSSQIVRSYLRKYRLNSENLNTVEIDILWDKYLYEFYLSLMPELKSDFAQRFLMLQIDIKNILSFFRLKTVEKDLSVFKSLFIKGGNILYATLAPLYKEEMESFASEFFYTPYSEAIKKGLEYYKEHKTLAELEKELDQFVLHILNRACLRVQGQDLLITYYWLRHNELSNLKTLLAAKTNNIDINWALTKIRGIV